MVEIYFGTILGLMVMVGATMILSAESGRRKGGSVQPGDAPEGGYANPLYRLHRAHLNSVETLLPFAITVFAAMEIGVGPGILALLVWGFVALRMAYIYLYLKGIGAPGGGIRTGSYIASTLVNVLILVLVVLKAL